MEIRSAPVEERDSEMAWSLRGHVRARGIVLIAAESALIFGAVSLAAYVRVGQDVWRIIADEHGVLKVVLVTAVCQVCLYYADLYELRKIADRRELFVRIF